MDARMFLNEDINGALVGRPSLGLNFTAGAILEANVYESSNQLTAWPFTEGDLSTRTRKFFC